MNNKSTGYEDSFMGPEDIMKEFEEITKSHRFHEKLNEEVKEKRRFEIYPRDLEPLI
ncbi:MAG: hypothetical protein ABEK17_02255 [Candidatus Aenigmatarchaeota archaeon]